MDDFKIEVSNYISEFIKTESDIGLRCEVKYENYTDCDISYQCEVFVKGPIFFVFNFCMLKEYRELKISQISLTNQQVKILASLSN